MNSFRAVERALDLRGRAAVRSLAGNGPNDWGTCPSRPAAGTIRPTSRTASGTKKNRATIATFPIRTSCPSPSRSKKSKRVRGELGELPAASAASAGDDVRHDALRQRRDRESGKRAGRLLRRRGRHRRRRQDGQQLGSARRAAAAQRTGHRRRGLSGTPLGPGRSAQEDQSGRGRHHARSRSLRS